MSKRIIADAVATIGAPRYAVTIDTRGHEIVSDEPVSAGGQDAGAAPFGLLLAALGSCTAITLKMYAERKEWPLESVRVALAYFRDGESAGITRDLTITGDLDAAQTARLADIAERTPVTLAIKGGLAIATRVVPG